MNIKEFCDKHHAGSEVREWALANCNTMQEAWDKCPNVNWMIWMATRPNVLDGRSLRLFAIWCCRQVQHLMRDQRSIAAVDAAEQFVNGLISPEQLAKLHQLTYTDAAAYAADADAADAAADAADAAAYAAAYAADADAADAYAARAADAAAADAYAARADAYAADADAYAAYAAAYAADADAADAAAYAAADAARAAAYAATYAADADADAADAARAARAAAYAAADVHKAAESKQMEYLRQNTKPNFE